MGGIMAFEYSQDNLLSKRWPELKEELGLFFLAEQLQLLGTETVITELEGYRGLTFQLFDHDYEIEHIKMDWFPRRTVCSRKHSWYSKTPGEFTVGIYVLELPKFSENYTQEMADAEFFTHLEATGFAAKDILADALNYISEKHGLKLGIHPVR